jgi:hypothetical protein
MIILKFFLIFCQTIFDRYLYGTEFTAFKANYPFFLKKVTQQVKRLYLFLKISQNYLFTMELLLDILNRTIYTYNLKSAGVWGASSNEVREIGLTSRSDPSADSSAHCLIDFSSAASPGGPRKFARSLKMQTVARGCLYKPPDSLP